VDWHANGIEDEWEDGNTNEKVGNGKKDGHLIINE